MKIENQKFDVDYYSPKVNHRNVMSFEEMFNYNETMSKKKGGSIILSFLKQLRPGMDMISLKCPTFLLSPYSFLETRTDYCMPTEGLLKIFKQKSISRRMVFLAEWVLTSMTFTVMSNVQGMKPFNPILGEQFHCKFNHKFDNSTTEVHCEQVSHHPPITCINMKNKDNNFEFNSTSQIFMKFFGNSVEIKLKGKKKIEIKNSIDGKIETYEFNYPSVLANGILFGGISVTHYGELNIVCKQHNIKLKVNCKGDRKHSLSGEIFDDSNNEKKTLFKIDGNLNDKIYVSNLKNNKKKCLVDYKKIKFDEKIIQPIEKQLDNESRKVWRYVTRSLKGGDLENASKEKYKIEERQREKAKKEREENFKPKLFSKIGELEYTFNL